MSAVAFLTRGTSAAAGGKRTARKGGSTMAEVVVGIAASHAPNLAVPSLMQGVKEEQYGTVKAGVGETAEGPVNEWLKIPKVTLRVAGELGRFLVSEGLENGVDFASSAELGLDHAEVVPLSYL